MKVMESRYYFENIKNYAKTWACVLLLMLALPFYTLAEGLLTDLWLWTFTECSDVLKNISTKREQDGDHVGIKIPRLLKIFHSFIS